MFGNKKRITKKRTKKKEKLVILFGFVEKKKKKNQRIKYILTIITTIIGAPFTRPHSFFFPNFPKQTYRNFHEINILVYL